jgi:hypothetical protein
MKHFQQRAATIRKYYAIIGTLMLVDMLQIMMTFTVKLSHLVRVKTLDSRVEYYLKRQSHADVDLDGKLSEAEDQRLEKAVRPSW